MHTSFDHACMYMLISNFIPTVVLVVTVVVNEASMEILAVQASYVCSCTTCTCQNDLLFAMDHLLWVTYEVIQSLRPLAPYLLVVLNV